MVAALLVLAAYSNRRVTKRYPWSLRALVVTYGLVAAAALLALAYGWKARWATTSGAAEHGAYDDTGLYTYYVMNDFLSPRRWCWSLSRWPASPSSACAKRLVSARSAPSPPLVPAVLGAVAVTGVPAACPSSDARPAASSAVAGGSATAPSAGGGMTRRLLAALAVLALGLTLAPGGRLGRPGQDPDPDPTLDIHGP